MALVKFEFGKIPELSHQAEQAGKLVCFTLTQNTMCATTLKCIYNCILIFVTKIQLTVYLLLQLPVYLACLLNFKILPKFHHLTKSMIMNTMVMSK